MNVSNQKQRKKKHYFTNRIVRAHPLSYFLYSVIRSSENNIKKKPQKNPDV